jgi:formate hydrogenlyase subunit 3/multisubunit Na+/H+ antiporter MnhD subunit
MQNVGIVSTAYLAIFLPLICSLISCFLGAGRWVFLLTVFCCVATFFLLLDLFPVMVIYNKIANAAPISLSPIATEFSLNMASLVLMTLLCFVKLTNLLHNVVDVVKPLKKSIHRAFYPVFLLNLFAVIGLCSTDSLINFLLFLEIYSLGFFAISSIASDRDLSTSSSNYFFLSVASSLLIIFCFVLIYLTYGEVNLGKISAAIAITPPEKSGFVLLLFVLLLIAFVIKFFPLRLYFTKLESASPISSFLATEAVFGKSLLGIFSIVTLLRLFSSPHVFVQFYIKIFLSAAAAMLMISSLFKLYYQRNSRLIVAYFCFINLGFILLCLAFPSFESLQAMFFFLLNFALVNLALFFYFNFLKQEEVEVTIASSRFFTVFAGVIIILFIVAFPMTILFFANWHFAIAFFNKAPQSLPMLLFLVIANLFYLNCGVKLLPVLFSKLTNLESLKISAGNYLRPISFWFLVATILILSLNPFLIGDIAIEFSSFLLPQLQ